MGRGGAAAATWIFRSIILAASRCWRRPFSKIGQDFRSGGILARQRQALRVGYRRRLGRRRGAPPLAVVAGGHLGPRRRVRPRRRRGGARRLRGRRVLLGGPRRLHGRRVVLGGHRRGGPRRRGRGRGLLGRRRKGLQSPARGRRGGADQQRVEAIRLPKRPNVEVPPLRRALPSPLLATSGPRLVECFDGEEAARTGRGEAPARLDLGARDDGRMVRDERRARAGPRPRGRQVPRIGIRRDAATRRDATDRCDAAATRPARLCRRDKKPRGARYASSSPSPITRILKTPSASSGSSAK